MPRAFILLTDLDGCLLDEENPCGEAATEVIPLLKSSGAPVCFITTKTRAEVEFLQKKLDLYDPAVIEGGGAVYFPKGQGDEGASENLQIELAAARESILPELERLLIKFDGARLFSELTNAKLLTITGLKGAFLSRARARKFSEPIFTSNDEQAAAVARELQQLQLAGSIGGRFVHALRGSNKKKGTETLLKLLNKPDAEIIAIGDAPGDADFLQLADEVILIQSANRSHTDALAARFPNATISKEPGTRGWAAAVRDLL